MMATRGLEDEIRFAAQKDVFTLVPKFVDDVLRPT
jgi:phosphosulfolactate phosphohydrolase-like enzyme